MALEGLRADEPEERQSDTRDGFIEVLGAWGLTPTQIDETLERTDFSLGLVELGSAEGEASDGIAIVVDDRRDRALRDVFDWREGADAARYAAEYEADPTAQVRVVLGPDEQALVRFAVAIRRPAALERRYLFAVHAVAPMLARLQTPGTPLWLVPSTVIEKAAARAGAAERYDVVDLCLRVATVFEPYPTVDEALAHVGAPRGTSAQPPPMNRAERRAAARRKRG